MALVCSAKSKIWMTICILTFGLTLFLVVGGALGWFKMENFLGGGSGSGTIITSNNHINNNMRNPGDYLQGGPISSTSSRNYSRTRLNSSAKVKYPYGSSSDLQYQIEQHQRNFYSQYHNNKSAASSIISERRGRGGIGGEISVRILIIIMPFSIYGFAIKYNFLLV